MYTTTCSLVAGGLKLNIVYFSTLVFVINNGALLYPTSNLNSGGHNLWNSEWEIKDKFLTRESLFDFKKTLLQLEHGFLTFPTLQCGFRSTIIKTSAIRVVKLSCEFIKQKKLQMHYTETVMCFKCMFDVLYSTLLRVYIINNYPKQIFNISSF